MNLIRLVKFVFSYLRGLWLLRSPKHSESIRLFKKGIECAGKNLFFLYECNKYIGIAYCYNNQYLDAKPHLLQAENIYLTKGKNENHDSELFAFLGLVFDAEANLKKAREYYEKAIKYRKKHDLTDISYIKSRLNKIDEYDV